MTVTFSIFITNEGILATRQAQQNPGWYIIPYQFRVSDTNRGVDATRKYASIDSNPWYSGDYSALQTPLDQNKIIHNVVIPPTIPGVSSTKNFGEIYFIYKNHNGQELLYAIGAPSGELTYVPGVAQKFYFSFSLNNVQVADIIQITDTSAQDIEDHNIDPNAHTIALASYQLLSEKNTANGYCPLDSSAKVPLSNLYNPLTTSGDIIVAGQEGAHTRLGLGNEGQTLVSRNGSLTYEYTLNPVGFCINSGNVNTNGQADLIVNQGDPYYYEQKITTVQTISTAKNTHATDGSWPNWTCPYQESGVDRWRYYITGSIFGASVGSGRYVEANYQQHKRYDGGWYDSGQYMGSITHTYTFSPALEPGTYRFLFCKMADYTSSYTLTAIIDGIETTISHPTDIELSATQWTPSSEITVTTSLSQIKVTTGQAAGTCVPALNLERVIVNSEFENKLYFKVGGEYPVITATHVDGSRFTKSVLNVIDGSTLTTDGTYNIFVPETGDAYALKDIIYRQKCTPTSPVTNDIWLNTSVFPYTCKKYNGSAWIAFDDIPLGKCTVSQGVINSVHTFEYNRGNNKIGFPDYSAGVSKSSGVTYTADVDGFLVVYQNGGGKALDVKIDIDEVTVSYICIDTSSISRNATINAYVKAGSTYKGSFSASHALAWIKFYPLI